MQIDKGVPRPKARAYRQVYPFPDMAVGDSIYVVREKAHSARVASIIYGNKSGKRFTSRKDGDGKRIWRIT